MEVRLSFTVAEHGYDPENGERFLEGFTSAFPGGGPSVSQDTGAGTLTVTFALDAKDAKEAIEEGLRVFVAGASESGLRPTDVLDIEASVVAAEESEAAELQPA